MPNILTKAENFSGRIIGITVEGINQTPATYALTTGNALVASGTHHVSFIGPPSGAVEIEVQILSLIHI